MSRCRLACAFLLGALQLGCEEPHRSEPAGAPSANEPSPNASVLPAPLAAAGPKITPRDAGHTPADVPSAPGPPEPPRPIRDDDKLPLEGELRPAPGVSLEARFRWLEPPPPRSPEGNNDALGRGRDKTSFDLSIDVSSLGRLRIAFRSRSFPFPPGTELRAREDRYGHALIWPGGGLYTTLPPGTLRASLAEVRVDVVPLAEPMPLVGGVGTLLALPTQKQKLETSVGKLELEQAQLPAAGGGGALLCRFLLELLAVAPDSSACHTESLPLRAEYSWASGARFDFEVSKLVRRTELAV
ncbi:MAG TPA: hypothetical protein VEQ59_17595, partial [Polyangiaceae bacterium]|nr:hypothetical protein [Polyangiaceae bacterium]